MPIEIERKYVLFSDDWRILSHEQVEIQQGYLCNDKYRTVRVRLWGDDGKVTIKGLSVNGARPEYEYDIPKNHAQEMLDTLCLPGRVHKIRHLIQFGSLTWEIDEFLDHNKGLLLAEIELPSLDTTFSPPTWLGPEVTNDHRFQNSHLSQHTVDTSSLL